MPTSVSYRTPNAAKPPPLARRFKEFDERTYARFRRALETRNLHLIRAAAADLPQVRLDDALEVCMVVRDRQPDRFEAAFR